MRPVIRYRSQLLFRMSYKPLRANAAKRVTFVFKPSRGFGSKPRFETVP